MDTNTLIPAPGGEPKVEEVSQPQLPDATVTDAEADAAARALDMTFFSASKAKHLKKVGLFQSQQGVVHLGVGRLAACDDALQRMVAIAVDLAESDNEETKDRINALQAGKALIDTLQKSIAMASEFQAEKMIAGPTSTKRRSFVDEQPVVPIQANAGSIVTVNVDSQPKPVQTTTP